MNQKEYADLETMLTDLTAALEKDIQRDIDIKKSLFPIGDMPENIFCLIACFIQKLHITVVIPVTETRNTKFSMCFAQELQLWGIRSWRWIGLCSKAGGIRIMNFRID